LNESSNKKPRIAYNPPIEEQPVEEQERPHNVPTEESRTMKRPIAADYFDQEDELTPTRTEEPLTKKQRLASTRIHESVAIDHIRSSNTDVYISARKSMMVRTYVHSKSKCTEALALLDSGATENFLELKYAEWLQLPIKRLPEDRRLLNVDGTENKTGALRFYTDLKVQTGTQYTTMRFFLAELGTNKLILGYPWFAAVQPNIDWKRGWIDHTQLPIVLRAPDAAKAIFTPRTKNVPRPVHHDQYYIGRVTIRPGKMQEEPAEDMFPNRRRPATPIEPIKGIPPEYQRHSKVFSEEASQRLPQHTIWDHAIELLDGAPTTLPGRLLPLTQEERQEAHNFVAEHLKRGTIQLSNSPYAANFFFVKKKDKKLRPVQDYRPVNKWTRKDRNVSPLIPEVIDRLSGCTLFTKFDVRWGYNNVRIREGDEWKAAFLTPEGLFEPTVMFFGLTNSPATFQMMMNTIFRREVALGWLSVYMDDIAIHMKPRPGETEEEHHARHQEYVHLVLDRLEANDLYLKPEKCAFEQKEIDYLGVIVGGNTLKMDPKKIEGVASWKEPTTVTEVRKFLGFTGYYRYFVPNYSKIARPLLDLTKKSTPWHWEERQQQAFDELKDRMCSKPVLKQPDFTKKFYLQVDASAYGVGAVLSQEGDITTTSLAKHSAPKLHPTAYYSATFTPTERNYDIYERELLAIMKSLAHWRPYLGWTREPFTILTDHANLQYWKAPKNLNRRTARWHADLQEYDYEIKHIPGSTNIPADALSRPPGVDKGEDDNQNVTIIPPEKFQALAAAIQGTAIRIADEDSNGSLEQRIMRVQNDYAETLSDAKAYPALTCIPTMDGSIWKNQDGRLVIPPDDNIRREIMKEWHDAPTAGHPGCHRRVRCADSERLCASSRSTIE
jgi:hypothetical protein